MRKHGRNIRTTCGISTIVLVLVLAFCVVLPLGIFGFEMSRYLLIQDQLRSVADCSALSGCAAMASVPEGGTEASRQQKAMQVAYTTFLQNSVLQTAFDNTNVTVNYNPQPPVPQSPKLHQAALNIILLDQNGVQVKTGDPAATMQVQAWYSDKPIFAYKLMDLGTLYTASAFSSGGLPSIDCILCFDVSGSMDDQTRVMYFKRHMKAGVIDWQRITPSKAQISDTIYNISQPDITGTSFNSYPPQNLSFASYGSPSNSNPLIWSEAPTPYPTPSSFNHLRVNAGYTPTGILTPEQGLPPGNLGTAVDDTAGGGTGWTDCVVDVSNGKGYPVTVNGATFTDERVVIEASRGNMEDDASLKQACGGALPGGFPKTAPGYFTAYWNYALQNSHPIQEARDAAFTFFNTMNISANSRFGFIAFSDSIGSGPSSSYAKVTQNLDANYAGGGTKSWHKKGFPLPLVGMDAQNKTSQQSYDDAITAVNGSTNQVPTLNDTALVALGKTNISDALNEAIKELGDTTKTRLNSKKAIVLFTDGIPNLPSDPNTGFNSALAAGSAAGKKNIPVYCIGLSQVKAIRIKEDQLLDDSAKYKGIAYRSSNGALYIPVTSGSNLQSAFQRVARSLCVIQ